MNKNYSRPQFKLEARVVNTITLAKGKVVGRFKEDNGMNTYVVEFDKSFRVPDMYKECPVTRAVLSEQCLKLEQEQ